VELFESLQRRGAESTFVDDDSDDDSDDRNGRTATPRACSCVVHVVVVVRARPRSLPTFAKTRKGGHERAAAS
jgi:hypothetical protein